MDIESLMKLSKNLKKSASSVPAAAATFDVKDTFVIDSINYPERRPRSRFCHLERNFTLISLFALKSRQSCRFFLCFEGKVLREFARIFPIRSARGKERKILKDFSFFFGRCSMRSLSEFHLCFSRCEAFDGVGR